MSRTPHDKLFKRIFKEPQYAAEELRALLPSPLVAALDWATLRPEPDSYVDQALADGYSDLVFSARAGEERVLVYVLFEHQSTNDERMALRLLKYMVEIWMHFAKDQRNVGEPLPLVIPVVLAHAPGGWTAKRRFAELFTEAAVGLAPHSIPDFEYAVDDLAKVSPDELQQRLSSDAVRMTLWVLRDARNGSSFLAAAGAWVPVLERIARDPSSLWCNPARRIAKDFSLLGRSRNAAVPGVLQVLATPPGAKKTSETSCRVAPQAARRAARAARRTPSPRRPARRRTP